MSDDDNKPVEPTAPVEQTGEPSAPAPAPATTETPEIVKDLEAEQTIEERVIAALRTVFDPEIPVNIYDLGLIYEVAVDDATNHVKVQMTLTSPACPVAGTLPGEVELRIKEIDAVSDAEVELVWDPPWDKDCLSDAAKLQLGLM